MYLHINRLNISKKVIAGILLICLLASSSILFAKSKSSSLENVYLIGINSEKTASSELQNYITNNKGKIFRNLKKVNILIVSMPDSLSSKITKKFKEVSFIEKNQKRTLLKDINSNENTTQTNNKTEETPVWNTDFQNEYDWGSVALNVPTLHDMNIQGLGGAICMLDSGIQASHPEFNNTIKEENFIDIEGVYTTPYDDANDDTESHGTRTSGVIKAQFGNQGKLKDGLYENGLVGVAPDVDFYFARLTMEYGLVVFISQAVEAIDWCMQKAENKNMVISMSFGSYTELQKSPFSKAEAQAINTAWEQGLLLLASSGNDGVEGSGTKYLKMYPAAYDNVIAVGSIDKYGNVSNFSNGGSFLDLVAPGDYITTTSSTGEGDMGSSINVNNSYLSKVYSVEGSNLNSINRQVILATDQYGTHQLCNADASDLNLSNNAALIEKGTCDLTQQIQNAIDSGAESVILYTADDSTPSGFSFNESKLSKSIIVVATKGSNTSSLINQYATISSYLSDYIARSGTSYSSPYAAIAAALVWSQKSDLTNEQLTDLLYSTANTESLKNTETYRIGNGLVDPLKAIQAVN